MEQVFISGLPVSAAIETDEQGATRIKMPTSDVDVRLWARVCRSLGFNVVYQYIDGRYRLDCICVDSAGNYRGVYSMHFASIWIGRDELFS
ncbi:MAG: hypothetical protein ACRDBQ_15200 [Shewanella sp.]